MVRKEIKNLFILFSLLVIVKAVLSYFIKSPSMFGDEYLYTKMARSFFEYGKFYVHGEPSSFFPPLYSLFLSIAYIFKDMTVVYSAMKIINSFLSSLIIFPAWLIAKEFLSRKKAFFVTILVAVMPSNFVFANYILSENLFYPLFLFAIYFIYKSFSEASYKWDVFAGIFVGLCYLTKMISLALIPLILIVLIIQLFREKNLKQIKKKFILFFIALLMVLPWLIRNAIYFGFTLRGISGGISGYVTELSSLQANFSLTLALYWHVLYVGYFILAAAVIFFIASLITSIKLKKFANKNLLIFSMIFWLAFIFLISAASIHNTSYPQAGVWLVGRPIGRYVDCVLPILLILGSIEFVKRNRESKFSNKNLTFLILLCSLILGLSYKLLNYSLFPVNNMSISYVGALNFLIKNNTIVMILLILLPFTFLFFYKLRFKQILSVFLIFLISLSLLNYGLTYYNSYNRWYKLDQMQLGLWFNSYDKEKSTILFDEREQTLAGVQDLPRKQPTLRAAFWMNNEIRLGKVENVSPEIDYIVSAQKLDLPIVNSKGKISIYKVK